MAGRVGFFLRVDDFDATYERMASAGVQFITSPQAEAYGRFAVFLDIAGNRWDLLGPPDCDASKVKVPATRRDTATRGAPRLRAAQPPPPHRD